MKHPVIHFEIMGHDASKLGEFYANVFGWNIAAPMPHHELDYRVVTPVPGFERGISGGIGKAPEGYDGHVTFYVVVDDVERALATIESAGGTRMMGPDQVPNGPTIGLFRDPEGHTIGLVQPSDDDMRGAPADLAPFVYFYGRCEEALTFYARALGGSYEVVMRNPDSTVSYATFTGNGFSFKASDGASSRAVDPEAGNISLTLDLPHAGRARETFEALADGGTVLTAFAPAPWGGYFGSLHDRFGTEWFVTAPLRDGAHAE